MNLKQSAVWLSRAILVFSAGLLMSCNVYHQRFTQTGDVDISKQILSTLEQSYPFSAHKGIDWQSYSEELQTWLTPPISDSNYIRIREWIYAIPDARLCIRSNRDQGLYNTELNGYAGFSLSRLPDGSCRVIQIDSLSEAFKKGLRSGDRLLGWNGQDIRQVIREKKLRWGIHPASSAFRELLVDHYMTFGKSGDSFELFYENPAGNTRGIRIPLMPHKPLPVPPYAGIPGDDANKPLYYSFGEYGVLTIKNFDTGTIRQFQNQIIDSLSDQKGLIIDLRDNQGGKDAIAAQIAAYFVSEEKLYEESIIWDPRSESWLDLGHIHVEPNSEIQFNFPVIMLLGPLCNGAGEGFARVLLSENNITSIGIWNTAGSFSYPGGIIRIGNKFEIHYPVGMSLDENGSILIESPGEYGGGIYPDIRISPDLEILQALANGNDILLAEAFAHLQRMVYKSAR